MKRYKITIKLNNGDQINSTVMARNQADAIRRLEKTPEVVEFIGDAEIDSVDVQPIAIEPIDNERFGVTTIDNKKGWYVVADLDNQLRVEWKKGKYNETHRIMPIGEGKQMDALQTATALREITDYLIENFNELL